MKYRILSEEATADLAFEAYGDSLKELFENAGIVVFNIMTDISKVEKKTEKRIEKKSEDLKSLLYDFLEELIFLHDSENLVFSEIKVDEIKNNHIVATVKGEKFDRSKHESRSLVKAVTYFGMEIKEDNGKWRAKVTLDL